MKFYGRKEELKRLAEISEHAETAGYLTMITGRRRVGKTTLVKNFLQHHTRADQSCYFFISRKQPRALLNEFAEILSDKFPEISGLRFENFEGFFQFLFQKLAASNFTFVMDEFQNFQYVDPAVFSILQKNWDEHKDRIKGHIIVIGSIQTLMHGIFEDKKEPLFKRLTGKIILQPFAFAEMRPLFDEHKLGASETALQLYLLFNGMPFYYYLMEREALYGRDLLEAVNRLALRQDGLLFNEGKELTIEELGRNYGRYFSILEAIAGGHTQWNNIATQSGIPHNSLGKYLDELVNYYGLVERKASVFSRDSSKTSRYNLHDNFLTFWFRYVYKYSSLLAESSADRILPKVRRDLPNFFGFQFEKFVKSWLSWQAGAHPDRLPFDHIGTYWDKGENEIDVVAYEDNGESCLVGECKWNGKRINLGIVDQLAQAVEVIERKRNFKEFNRAIFVGDHLAPKLKEKLQEHDIRVFEMADYWS